MRSRRRSRRWSTRWTRWMPPTPRAAVSARNVSPKPRRARASRRWQPRPPPPQADPRVTKDGGSNFLTYREDMEPRGDGLEFSGRHDTLLTDFSARCRLRAIRPGVDQYLAEKIKMIVGIADDVFKDIIDATTSDGRRRLLFADAQWRGAAAAPRRGGRRARGGGADDVTTTLLVNGTNVTVNVTELSKRSMQASTSRTVAWTPTPTTTTTRPPSTTARARWRAATTRTPPTSTCRRRRRLVHLRGGGLHRQTAYNFNQTWYDENGCSSAGACSDDGSCAERKCGCMATPVVG